MLKKIVDPAAIQIPEEPITPVDASAITETSAEEIIQAADENNLTLVDASGNPLSMAAEETIELLETGDPFFWSTTNSRWEGYTNSGSGCPGIVFCIPNPNPFQAAINAAPVGATIYVEAGSYTENVIIDKADLALVGYSSISFKSDGSVDNINHA